MKHCSYSILDGYRETTNGNLISGLVLTKINPELKKLIREKPHLFQPEYQFHN